MSHNDNNDVDLTVAPSDRSWMSKLSSAVEQVNVGEKKIQLPPAICPNEVTLCKSFLLQTMSATLLLNQALDINVIAQTLGSCSCSNVI